METWTQDLKALLPPDLKHHCLVILRRPGHDWPLILAANRDEMIDRPWQPPARHWPDRPEVLAGLKNLGDFRAAESISIRVNPESFGIIQQSSDD